MIEQIWKKSVHKEVLGSDEHQVLPEHRFALGKDLAGRHICKGDIAVFPEEDGSAPIREVSADDIARGIPLLVVSPESIEDIRPYLGLQPLLHIPIAENEQKKINLADEHQHLYIDLMMNLSCSVSQGKCFCSAEDKPVDETNEWYVIEDGQTVSLRRGFTLGYSNGQLTLSKVAASKDPNTPELQELAYAALWRYIEKEAAATSPKEYQLEHGIIIPAHQRDFAQITELSEDAVQRRLIYRARQLNIGKEEEAEEEVRKSVAEWKNNRETILRSDTLIVFGRGGIGDAPYQFLAASVLAKQYPEKKVLFVSHLVSSPLLTPQSQNMCVVPSLHDAREYLVDAKETAVFSLSFANGISNEETEKIVRYLHSLRRQDDSPARAKIEANASQTVLDRMRQILTHALLAKGISRLQMHNPSTDMKISSPMKVNWLVDLQSSQLWQHFGKYFGPIDGALREQLSSLYAQATGKQPMVAEQYHFDRLSQLEEYAGMMTHLFGCDPEVVNEVLQELPIRMPEVHTEQRADIIFVYDAKSGTFGDEKIFNPDQLIRSIKGLSERYPDKTIGIVIGNTHPDVAKFVLHACPMLVPIEGEFEQVLGTCVDADVVVSVDTGFLHLLNFYKKRAAQLQREDESQKEVKLPHVIGVFGLNTPFPLGRFMPTEVECVMVSKGNAKDISPEEIVKTVSELIR